MNIKNNHQTNIWIEKLNKVLLQFKIIPKNYSKYVQALTHPSYSHENNLRYNYQRFEFIGDAAISWIISNFLFSDKSLSEGEMSIKKAKLVSGSTLSIAAKKIKLDELVFVGKGLEKLSAKILEDFFESFIGVIANDVGIKKAAKVVQYCVIDPYLNGEINTNKPYKTMIQEALMRNSTNGIKYTNLSSHKSKVKKVALIFDGIIYGVGQGETLRLAEENAAKNAYSKLSTEKNK